MFAAALYTRYINADIYVMMMDLYTLYSLTNHLSSSGRMIILIMIICMARVVKTQVAGRVLVSRSLKAVCDKN